MLGMQPPNNHQTKVVKYYSVTFSYVEINIVCSFVDFFASALHFCISYKMISDIYELVNLFTYEPSKFGMHFCILKEACLRVLI